MPKGTEWLWLGGISAIGLALFNVAVVRGLLYAQPTAIAVALACVPVLLGVIGPPMEHRTPRGRVLVAAMVVTLGGTMVEGGGRTSWPGVAWAVVALGCESAFTLLAMPVLERHGAWGVSFHGTWIASAMLLTASLLTEGLGQSHTSIWRTGARLACWRP